MADTGLKVVGAYGFGLEVPDLAVAEAYFSALGMVVRSRGGTLALGCSGRDQDELILARGPRKRIHHVAFAIAPGTADAFAAALQARGVACQRQPPVGGGRAGVWLQDPWGTWIALIDRPQAPMRGDDPVLPMNTHGQRRRVGTLAYEALDKAGLPLRFQHVLLFTPEFERAERWYVQTFGFGIADHQPGRVTFLLAGAGECWDHHCFALVANAARGLHHASFEMTDMDQLGFCQRRMRDRGYAGGFGPGRQFLGSNLFAYIEDPWGSYTEISADMDQLDATWRTRRWDAIPKLWGPDWAVDFWTANREAAA